MNTCYPPGIHTMSSVRLEGSFAAWPGNCCHPSHQLCTWIHQLVWEMGSLMYISEIWLNTHCGCSLSGKYLEKVHSPWHLVMIGGGQTMS